MVATEDKTDTEARGGTRPSPRALGDEARHLGAFISDHVFVPIRRDPGNCNECGSPIAVHKFKKATG